MTRDEIIKALGVASGQMTVTLGAYIAAAPVWDLQTIERVVDGAVKQERARCADIALRTVCDVHTPTGIKIYGTRAAKAIMEDGA